MVALIGRRVLELEAREHWDESIVGRVTGLLSKGVQDARELIHRTEGQPLPSTDRPETGPAQHVPLRHGPARVLGSAIGAVMILEIVRQVLLLQDLQVSPIDFQGGPVPQSWQWRWKPA